MIRNFNDVFRFDPENYKQCRKKIYEIKVALPPIGTYFVNKLEQPEMVLRMHKNGFGEAVQTRWIHPNMRGAFDNEVAKGNMYKTDKAVPFALCGTRGEYWTIKFQKLQSTYSFVTSGGLEAITEQSVKKRIADDGIMDWTTIRTKGTNTLYACFVPVNIQGAIKTSWGTVLHVNHPMIKHGKGDFVLMDVVNGRPSPENLWVVNGLVFADTYDNRGWTQYLAETSGTSGVIRYADFRLAEKRKKAGN